MRERKPQHFKLGSDQVGDAKCASESRDFKLGSDQVGMLMRGGPRSIIETGSDQVGDPHNAATADVKSARAMAASCM